MLHGSPLDGTIPYSTKGDGCRRVRALGDATMHLFIQRQNVLFFQKQLAGELTEPRRLQLLKLLAEEEAKLQGPVSPGDTLAMR